MFQSWLLELGVAILDPNAIEASLANGVLTLRLPKPDSLKPHRIAINGGDEQPVCDALTVLAREAQERQLHAEHMLIAFKRVWGDLPEVHAIPTDAERRRMLDRVVKLCIDTYYKR